MYVFNLVNKKTSMDNMKELLFLQKRGKRWIIPRGLAVLPMKSKEFLIFKFLSETFQDL